MRTADPGPSLSVCAGTMDPTMVSTEPSIFSRILSGEIPGEILLQTDRVFVIRDLHPQAPVHLLVIPKTARFANVVELAAGDHGLLAHMVEVAQTAAVQAGSPDFRLVFNTGGDAGQTVFHVHAHVLGGGVKETPLA